MARVYSSVCLLAAVAALLAGMLGVAAIIGSGLLLYVGAKRFSS